MERFVILEHDWPQRHFDILLEAGDVLRSWRISTEPTLDKIHQARVQPDHRKFYLDYEGPVSNDRGNVSRWDTGPLQWLQVEPNHCVVKLDGERLRGIATLLKCEEAWTFSVVSSLQNVDRPPDL